MKLHSKILTLLACAMLVTACGTSGGSTSEKPTTDTSGGDTTGGDTTTGTDAGAKTDTTAKVDSSSGKTDAGSNDPCECTAEKQCGFIPNCPLSCGACQQGKKCVANKCVVDDNKPPVTGGTKELGEFCGPTKDCQAPPQSDNEAQYQQALQAYYQCLNSQCKGGTCLGNICTMQCKIKKDEINNATGEKGADGIEDPDEDFSDCVTDIKDGPKGKKFRCVEYRSEAEVSQGQSLQFCYAGETFKECKNDGDCIDGESCQLQRIYGKFALRCAPAYKNPDASPGQKSSYLCNNNIIKGDIKLCTNGMCTGIGCRSFCKSEADCNTASAGDCKAGKCPNGGACTTDMDCSAWTCTKGLKLYSDLEDTFDLCSPKACEGDANCPSEFFCRISYNGVKNPAGDPDPDDPNKITKPGWGHICQRRKDAVAKVGEACDAFPTDDDDTYKPCETLDWYCSMGNGICGNICKADSDCAKDMKCPALEFPFDLDDDKTYETFLPTGLCNSTKGNVKKDPCYSNNDCKGAAVDGKDQSCKAWSWNVELPSETTGAAAETFITSGGLCVDSDAKKGNYGDFCGSQSPIKHCNSGTCLTLSSGAGLCTDLCNQRTDCKDPVTIQGQTFKSYCTSISVGGFNGTAAPYDDYRRAYCLWTQSSVDDCKDTKTCKSNTEACTPRVILWGPDKAAKVEYWCNTVQNYAASQNDPPPPQPSKEVGDECDLEADLIQCKTMYCMRDVKTGKGYCSKPCNGDADCPSGKGLHCAKDNMGFPGFPRMDKTKAAIVPMCMKAKSCIGCEYDYQCAGDYKCTNLGKGGTLANLRCAPSCEADNDCAAVDGGIKCVPAVDTDGKELGHKVCKPGC